MDIQKIDLRRGDFEAMHPKAKLLNFDAEKMVYFGDKSESINSQWTTWCACIGMLCLDGKETQAVPEGFVLMPKEPNYKIMKAITSYILGENQHGVPVGLEPIEAEEIYELLVQAVQEPAND